MEKELIERVNHLAYEKMGDTEQGVYVEPYGIPVHIKEPVVYMRWETGGMRGGSYHPDAYAHPYKTDVEPKFQILDIVLKELKPNISFLQFREIEGLIQTTNDTENDYYGNSTDYEIRYIILSELEKLLATY